MTATHMRRLTPTQLHLLAASLLVALFAAPGRAQERNTVVIDASQPTAPPDTGYLQMGSNRAPSGATITANSRFLMRDGRPWLPVMGEFHFSRYPAQYWEEELLKMKAGGVQVVATYVFWNHHEEVEGPYDWSGQKNLRRFVELAGRHGLYVIVRMGPWSHGEARNGGYPDWLLAKGVRVRSNDPAYLTYVRRHYGEIARQLRGLLWKDGGPVVGVQLENEYTARGPGQGSEHIAMLKQIARDSGVDVPLYTVTGWDGASFPPRAVLPVFGGYPAAPWDGSIAALPPNEVYLFRFANRVAGDMGTQGTRGETSQESLARYPFVTAEMAGGIEDTYHRRPVIAPADVAAMVPVMLGSGANLYGYYMFHGGTNPLGRLTTLQESQRSGYPTDVPVRSYDFQAPIGEFGDMRPSFGLFKLYHFFLNDFGEQLAPMVARRPEVVPASAADTTVPRFAARTLGDRGFVFFTNHVRNYPMPERQGVQVTLRLPSGTLQIPRAPIAIPPDAYGIWPVNLDLGETRLTYSTAQLLARVAGKAGGATTYFFVAIPGIAPEFAFDSTTVADVRSTSGTTARAEGRIYVSGIAPGSGVALTVRDRAGAESRVVVLTREQAAQAWKVTLGGRERLVLTPQQLFVAGDAMHLRAKGDPAFSVAAFPAFDTAPGGAGESGGLTVAGSDGVFTRYRATVTARSPKLTYEMVRPANPAPPVQLMNAVTWRKNPVAVPPADSAFARAAVWRVHLPADLLAGLSDAYLELPYQGDIARVYTGDTLLDDNFFNGTSWTVGLKRFGDAARPRTVEVRVLPLRADAPIYLDASYRPTIPSGGQLAALPGVRLVPEYELVIGAQGRTRNSGLPAAVPRSR